MLRRKICVTFVWGNGTRVSVVSLGNKIWRQQNNESRVFAQLNFVELSGINLFDAAEIYQALPRPETYVLNERFTENWFSERVIGVTLFWPQK